MTTAEFLQMFPAVGALLSPKEVGAALGYSDEWVRRAFVGRRIAGFDLCCFGAKAYALFTSESVLLYALSVGLIEDAGEAVFQILKNSKSEQKGVLGQMPYDFKQYEYLFRGVNSQWLTTREVARILGVSVESVLRQIRFGNLAACRNGGRVESVRAVYRIARADFVKFLSERSNLSESERLGRIRAAVGALSAQEVAKLRERLGI